MEYLVKNQQGDTVETIELSDEVFGVPMNHTLIHQAVVIYQGNKRQGTHDTKTRAQVSGGGRKPWIQKHTGRARQGSTRSPQWRHGGVVFGPHPREYRKDIPRKMRRKALKCALSEKVRQNSFVCLDSTDQLTGKTQSMTNLLNNLGISNSALIVTTNAQENVFRAGHNIPKVWTTPVNLLNANDILSYHTIVMTIEAARLAEAMWATPVGHREKRTASSSLVTTTSTSSDSNTADESDTPAPTRRRSRAAVANPDQESPPTARRRGSTAATSNEEAPPTPRRRRTATSEPNEEPAPTPRRRRTTAATSNEEAPPTPRRRRTASSEPEVE